MRLTIWVGAFALLTLVIVGFYGAELAMDMRRDYVGRQLHASARHIGELLASQLEEREKEVHILSRSPLLAEVPLESRHVQRALELRKQESPEYAWLAAVSSEGKVLSAAGSSSQAGDVASAAWFLASMDEAASNEIHESTLIAEAPPEASGRQAGRVIRLSAPIRKASGKVHGVLAAQIHWSWLTSFAEHALDADGTLRHVGLLIADEHGTTLYPPSRAGAQSPAAAGDVYAVEIVDGRQMLMSRASLPVTRHSALAWSIVLEQPLDVALQPVVDLRNRLVVLGLVLSFGLAASAYVLAARISRPLERLVRAIGEVEGGRSGPEAFPASLGSTEMTLLVRSVRSMTETLLEREDRLEHMVAQRTLELQEANRELARLAMQDALTGLSNRRAFDERCGFEEARSRRSGRPLGIVIIDVDRFKSINDTFGHSVGDRVLQQLAHLLQLRARETDLVARFGGEEFALLLPEVSSEEDALQVGEQIRLAVESWTFEVVGQLTVSVGCAVVDTSKASIAQALSRADAALYRAKESGRNRCVGSGPLSSGGT